MPFTLSEMQRQFSAALLDPESPPPTGLRGQTGEFDEQRFAIHRNNLFVGLIDALAARFPVCERLVGQDFFRSMARAYVAEQRPRSPILLHYGDAFPDFIAGFAPAAELAYLADVARLEAARSSAYHAADAIPLRIETIASCRPVELIEARLTLHPSLRLVRSPHPIAAIWTAHQGGGEHVDPPAQWEAEDVLVLRAETEVLTRLLPAGAHSFISALVSGETLAQAGAAGLSESEGFDLGRNLTELFTVGAVVDLHLGKGAEVRQ
jgi:hypothetical protein